MLKTHSALLKNVHKLKKNQTSMDYQQWFSKVQQHLDTLGLEHLSTEDPEDETQEQLSKTIVQYVLAACMGNPQAETAILMQPKHLNSKEAFEKLAKIFSQRPDLALQGNTT